MILRHGGEVLPAGTIVSALANPAGIRSRQHSLETGKEQVEVIHLRDLVNEGGQAVQEGVRIEVIDQIEIDTVLAAGQEGRAIAPAVAMTFE